MPELSVAISLVNVLLRALIDQTVWLTAAKRVVPAFIAVEL
jgi:hypothetical protein